MNMNITITVDVDKVEKLAEESEMNDSSFIRTICSELLTGIALETKRKGTIAAKRINMVNPFGFPVN